MASAHWNICCLLHTHHLFASPDEVIPLPRRSGHSAYGPWKPFPQEFPFHPSCVCTGTRFTMSYGVTRSATSPRWIDQRPAIEKKSLVYEGLFVMQLSACLMSLHTTARTRRGGAEVKQHKRAEKEVRDL
ncbi:hypothetical protein E1301_Tti013833 [Triplophysa tibetana]|uniref:Uncharacterized protein n=1 Tax=Triplophysa tibetana TaxID=1572043 RepID=A0A5A9P9R0_9TELE|nr:hypothetical protein E1301_Tti013833 [Triplophysa tibetana]